MTYTRYKNGFSLIEILISMLLVLSLSAISYRVLKSLTFSQRNAIKTQKSNSGTQYAIDRFKTDVSMIDYNWTRFGVASIYPHPGLGFSTNYYTDASISQVEKLNDGVTFLRRSAGSDKIYNLDSARYCFPNREYAADKTLYSDPLELNSSDGLKANDWVLMYEAGLYSLGIVTVVGNNRVSIRMPNALEEQSAGLDARSHSTGYISKAGVLTANSDIHSNVTSRPSDDSFCLDPAVARVQKISAPVSYFADYRTSDGQEKSIYNSYVLDSHGNKQRMLVRTEYSNGLAEREYLTSIDSVGFSYDELTDDTSVSGGVLKDIGRDPSTNLKDLSNANPNQIDNFFDSTNKLVAIRINIAGSVDSENERSANAHAQDLKIALDPSAGQDLYQDSMSVISSMTNNISTTVSSVSTSVFDNEMGKPLYLLNGTSEEMIIPVSNFEIAQNGSIGTQSSGSVNIYTPSGCAVNSQNCDPTNRSSIVFSPGSNKIFFPNTISQLTKDDGSIKILVGGMTVTTSGNNLIRKPSIGVIDLAPGESLASRLENPISGECNISGCSVQTIDNTKSGMSDFMDTANMAVDKITGDIYVTSMTKKFGDTSPAVLYKGTWSGDTLQFSNLGPIPGTDDGRVVTALSDTMQVSGKTYVVASTSKKISDSCGSGGCLVLDPNINSNNTQLETGFTSTHNNESDHRQVQVIYDQSKDQFGKIMLLNYDTQTSQLNTIDITSHNYRASSLIVDDNNDVIVTARLTSQVIPFNTIQQALTDPTYQTRNTSVMYLDEIAAVKNGSPIYADIFQVDPKTYPQSNDQNVPAGPQSIGWLSGASAAQFDDGTYGLVNANKFRLAPDFMDNAGNSDTKEFANVGIEKIKLAGITDRVIATIERDPVNINNSKVSATFTPHFNELPNVYFPGTLYVNASNLRNTPTALPLASPSMEESSWVKLYQQMLSPNGSDGINNQMPIYGPSMKSYHCYSGYPSTCASVQGSDSTSDTSNNGNSTM